MSTPSVPVGRTPVQARSRASVEQILDAAGLLLAERGAAGFTMSDLADRAGVAIGSLYRWFPAQSSVVLALAERHMAAGRNAAAEAVAAADGAPDQQLEGALRAYLAWCDDRLVVETMRAIRADPALRALDRADTQLAAETLTGLAGLPPERTPVIGLAIDLAGHLIIDLADRPPPERAALVDAFVELVRPTAVLDPPSRSAPSEAPSERRASGPT